MKNKENLIKKIELANEQSIKDFGLLLTKYYAKGYEEGRKDAVIAIKHKPCKNGYKHTLKINRNGFIICSKCLEEFHIVADSEVKRLGIVFV